MQIDGLIDGEAAVDPKLLYGGEHPPTGEDWAPYAQKLLFAASHFPGLKWGRRVARDSRPIAYQEV